VSEKEKDVWMIPEDYFRQKFNHPVNILTGVNGSGKSYYLNTLARSYLGYGCEVIAVATSVYDKFDCRSRRFHFLGGRSGRNIVVKTVKEALVRAFGEKSNSISHLLKVLKYTRFGAEIRVQLDGFNYEGLLSAKKGEHSSGIYQALSFLSFYFDELKSPDVVVVDLEKFSPESSLYKGLGEVIANESILKKMKVIKGVGLELDRNSQIIPLSDASSGELMILSTLMHISSYIDSNSIILIDEPENSLHPRWQQQYVENILDLFSYYQPKLIIATHSPLIIPLEAEGAGIYEIYDGIAYKIDQPSNNNEEVLADVFGVVTPENRFLSDEMVRLLNRLDEDSLQVQEALDVVNNYRRKSMDEKVLAFLDGVEALILQTKVG